MQITKEHLDKRICDVETDAANTQTYREFIIHSEMVFEAPPQDLDSMNDEQLNRYLDFMDYLWTK
jgi:hypothetical protein